MSAGTSGKVPFDEDCAKLLAARVDEDVGKLFFVGVPCIGSLRSMDGFWVGCLLSTGDLLVELLSSREIGSGDSAWSRDCGESVLRPCRWCNTCPKIWVDGGAVLIGGSGGEKAFVGRGFLRTGDWIEGLLLLREEFD